MDARRLGKVGALSTVKFLFESDDVVVNKFVLKNPRPSRFQ